MSAVPRPTLKDGDLRTAFRQEGAGMILEGDCTGYEMDDDLAYCHGVEIPESHRDGCMCDSCFYEDYSKYEYDPVAERKWEAMVASWEAREVRLLDRNHFVQEEYSLEMVAEKTHRLHKRDILLMEQDLRHDARQMRLHTMCVSTERILLDDAIKSGRKPRYKDRRRNEKKVERYELDLRLLAQENEDGITKEIALAKKVRRHAFVSCEDEDRQELESLRLCKENQRRLRERDDRRMDNENRSVNRRMYLLAVYADDCGRIELDATIKSGHKPRQRRRRRDTIRTVG